MASANLDLVRSMFAAWERGDFSSVDWADPEIDYMIADGPSPGQWTGLAGMARGWREVMNAYHGIRVEIEEARELDDERVLVLVRFAGQGKTSGLAIDRTRAIGAVADPRPSIPAGQPSPLGEIHLYPARRHLR